MCLVFIREFEVSQRQSYVKLSDSASSSGELFAVFQGKHHIKIESYFSALR